MDDLDVAGENVSSTPTSTSTGITLVLPSLRALKAANAGRKSKPLKDAEQRPKIPRPIKLKPLKEVLSKLITQIKKKDDYAFFIHPVDPAQVPGYADAITHPMDFGTMSVKVARGRYRSLEEFTADFRLVTTNAKTFNPPGSIYYTEADRLEAWGLDHISRASVHVIEYETDWNIDIEQDEDGSTSQHINVVGEDDVSTPREIEESLATGSRAPSSTPAPGQAVSQQGQGKRGPRGPYKRHAPTTTLSESLDAEGRMPGAKDGVGAFPAGSDWANLMVALKIKGKRYKTKKERLRFEKEGPPYLPDGSIDYAEMEDPFSVLNVFVPDPPTRPQITPLYPTTSLMAATSTTTLDSTQAQSLVSDIRIHSPIAFTIPPDRPDPILSTLSNIPAPSTTITTPTSSTQPPLRPPKRRRHWTIVRNVPARSRAKDKEGDTGVAGAEDTKPSWQVPREAGPADYGTFAALLGELAASAAVSSHSNSSSATTGTAAAAAADYVYGSQHRLFATIRSTVVHQATKRKEREEEEEEEHELEQKQEDGDTFWTDARAEEAWDYLRDVVYGGVDGYAYVRSLAEFVAPSIHLPGLRGDGLGEKGRDDDGIGGEIYMNTSTDTPPQGPSPSLDQGGITLPLPGLSSLSTSGVSLARYVEDNLVNTVTRGRHGWLRDVLLASSYYVNNQAGYDELGTQNGHHGKPMISPFEARRATLPSATHDSGISQKLAEERLDLASLIRAPEELAEERGLEGSEGTGGAGGEREAIERALKWSVGVIEGLTRRSTKGQQLRVKEEEEEEATVEQSTDAMDVDSTSKLKAEPGSDTNPESEAREDPLMRRLRLNLLALAKRAPLDKIASLPVDLVPEDIRGIVPIAS